VIDEALRSREDERLGGRVVLASPEQKAHPHLTAPATTDGLKPRDPPLSDAAFLALSIRSIASDDMGRSLDSMEIATVILEREYHSGDTIRCALDALADGLVELRLCRANLLAEVPAGAS
jgi:hypothetical protein